jgi:hypothetical protein
VSLPFDAQEMLKGDQWESVDMVFDLEKLPITVVKSGSNYLLHRHGTPYSSRRVYDPASDTFRLKGATEYSPVKGDDAKKALSLLLDIIPTNEL